MYVSNDATVLRQSLFLPFTISNKDCGMLCSYRKDVHTVILAVRRLWNPFWRWNLQYLDITEAIRDVVVIRHQGSWDLSLSKRFLKFCKKPTTVDSLSPALFSWNKPLDFNLIKEAETFAYQKLQSSNKKFSVQTKKKRKTPTSSALISNKINCTKGRPPYIQHSQLLQSSLENKEHLAVANRLLVIDDWIYIQSKMQLEFV